MCKLLADEAQRPEPSPAETEEVISESTDPILQLRMLHRRHLTEGEVAEMIAARDQVIDDMDPCSTARISAV
jgi:hypothetical protein